LSAEPSPIVTILALAFLLRVVVALSVPNILAPDEVFQFLEQAHRLVYGQGIVPWEYQIGLRNWLIPLALALPMALNKVLGFSPLAGLMLIRVLLCIASLGIVWAGAKWGERFYGRQGLWIAGLFCALWPDLWVFAPHPLEEVLSADVMVPAIYLAGTARTPRRTAAAAFLLGLTFVLREQLAPAIAIAGIALCRRDRTRWALALPIAAIPVFAAGGLDWFTWGQPFRSFWLNIDVNVFHGVAAATFGASPAGFFVYLLSIDWLWTLPVIVYLAWRGARLLPVAGFAALSILLTHTLISHKELRFIFPAIALAVPLAGLGLSGLLATNKVRLKQLALGLCLLVGPLVSPWPWFLLDLHANSARAFEDLAARHVTLVAVQPLNDSYLPLDILLPATARLTVQAGPDADAIVFTRPGPDVPAGFARVACYKSSWIPLASNQNPGFCSYINANPAPSIAPSIPFTFPFPAAALPFKIPDRLTDETSHHSP
jgi:hypothetical protein